MSSLELFPFQKEGADFLKSRLSAMLGHEMGLGKTVMAIAAINDLKARKILIVCPAIVKLNWEKELNIWLKEKLKIQVLFGRVDQVKTGSDVVIVNYDLLISPPILKQILSLRFAVGVFDESHYLKNRSAKRTKAVLFKGAVASRCVYRWFLTGTPILNRPVELYPVLKAAAPEVLAPYMSFDSFARHFCGGYWDGFQLVAKGATNTDELAMRLNGFMLRRLKKEVLKELPDKMYRIVSIPPATAEIKKLIVKEFEWSKDEVKSQKFSADGAEIAILRHKLALAKVDTAVAHIKDLLEENQKIVVFAYHRDVIKALDEKLSEYAPVVITGETSAERRSWCVLRFQIDPHNRVFVGQITAAGIGITLTAASTVVFVESSWVPGEIDQATDRLHRIGQKDSVLVQFLVLEKSLEEHMLKTVIEKRKTIAKIVDNEVAQLFA